jgi:hypothetical protein
VRGLLFYLLLCAAPGLAFVGLARVVEWWSKVDRPPWRRPDRGVPRAPGPPLQRVAADLRRLEQEYLRVERSDAPAKAFRLRAVSLAYDDTLVEACRILELPAPPSPLTGVDRVRAQAELARAGLTW